jgi:dCMP deaminase
MMSRPDVDLYFMRMARLVSTRSTCLRRAVGCILVDARRHVLSTGYNGVAAGEPHCNEIVMVGKDFEDLGGGVMRPRKMVTSHPNACPGATAASGTNLEGCAAVHAEQNCLIQCRDAYTIETAYVTVAPCDPCLKLLLNTSCQRLIVGGWYNNNEVAVRRRWGSRTVILDERR